MSTRDMTDDSAVPVRAMSARRPSSGSSSCMSTGGMRCLASRRRYLRSRRMLSEQFLLMKVVATPVFPQRPVRPMRCTYVSISLGMSKLITCCTSGKSRPLAATSVATSTSALPNLNCRTANSRSSCALPPWELTASTPLTRRYSWMSSTSALFSQKMRAGGAVFCRHSRRYTRRASCFTYSTSWITSRFAAPARPTLTTTGWTSADLAKFWMCWGMVAEKRTV
mmetsp:Transcript_77202/g.208422  ORF Transcript_77202/g.208422 Transcript_77202/m.208422 type:complete len:224 (-) Transcript_77202:911-1582(-)